MRVAFFGGSFDPPHLGHLQIALTAMARLRLDRVLLAPAGRQPLKRREAAGFADRMAMLRLLTEGHVGLEASECDAPLGGAGAGAGDEEQARPNYTVDTLARLRPALLKSLARGGVEVSGEEPGSVGIYGAGSYGADGIRKPGETERPNNQGKPGNTGETGYRGKPYKLDEPDETEKSGEMRERNRARLSRLGKSDEQGRAGAVGGLGQRGRLELFFLAGADSFLTLPQWHRPEELLRGTAAGGCLDGWILAARPGFPLEALGGALPVGYRLEPVRGQDRVDAEDKRDELYERDEMDGPDGLSRPDGRNGPDGRWDPERLAGPVVTRQVWLPGDREEAGGTGRTKRSKGIKGAKGVKGTRLYLLPDLEDPSTATSIREALLEGRAAAHLQPEISQYIRDHGLYRMLG